MWLRLLPIEFGQLLLGVAELLEQQAIGARLFQRIEVGALDVLDQGDFQRLAIRQFADENRNVMNAGALRGAPAPLARDDFIFSIGERAHDDGLQQALVADRLGKFVEIRFGEMLARIVGAGLQQLDRHVAQRADILHHRFFAGVVADQRGQPAAQPLLRGACHVHVSSLLSSGVRFVSDQNRSGRAQFALAPDDLGGQPDIGL